MKSFFYDKSWGDVFNYSGFLSRFNIFSWLSSSSVPVAYKPMDENELVHLKLPVFKFSESYFIANNNFLDAIEVSEDLNITEENEYKANHPVYYFWWLLKQGRQDDAIRLLESKPEEFNPNAKFNLAGTLGSRSYSLLTIAIESGASAVVSYLAPRCSKAALNFSNSYHLSAGRTAIMFAAEVGNSQIVDDLLKTGKINVNAEIGQGDTALSLAIPESKVDSGKVVESLIRAGAKLCLKLTGDQRTKDLHGNLEVKMKNGRCTDSWYNTNFLMSAAYLGKPETAKALVQAGNLPVKGEYLAMCLGRMYDFVLNNYSLKAQKYKETFDALSVELVKKLADKLVIDGNIAKLTLDDNEKVIFHSKSHRNVAEACYGKDADYKTMISEIVLSSSESTPKMKLVAKMISTLSLEHTLSHADQVSLGREKVATQSIAI